MTRVVDVIWWRTGTPPVRGRVLDLGASECRAPLAWVVSPHRAGAGPVRSLESRRVFDLSRS